MENYFNTTYIDFQHKSFILFVFDEDKKRDCGKVAYMKNYCLDTSNFTVKYRCFCKKVKPPYYFYNSRSGNKVWETRRWQGNIKKMVACTNTKILKHFSFSIKIVTKIIYWIMLSKKIKLLLLFSKLQELSRKTILLFRCLRGARNNFIA